MNNNDEIKIDKKSITFVIFFVRSGPSCVPLQRPVVIYNSKRSTVYVCREYTSARVKISI